MLQQSHKNKKFTKMPKAEVLTKTRNDLKQLETSKKQPKTTCNEQETTYIKQEMT